MTDEEKIRELIKCGEWCESINKCDYKNTGVNCYAYGIAMGVAAWKEQQMIEKMENFVKRLYLPAYPYQDRENEELINDIKEAMLEEE